ncbi:hypothetical protein BJV78DRAFT_1355111 [Lactifluus subvellereus]|nr:hypothetical protein BJV78DRAFT_1355111 [Lactifluus subvellereus]
MATSIKKAWRTGGREARQEGEGLMIDGDGDGDANGNAVVLYKNCQCECTVLSLIARVNSIHTSGPVSNGGAPHRVTALFFRHFEPLVHNSEVMASVGICPRTILNIIASTAAVAHRTFYLIGPRYRRLNPLPAIDMLQGALFEGLVDNCEATAEVVIKFNGRVLTDWPYMFLVLDMFPRCTRS